MQVVGMTPPVERLGKDSLVWGLEADGRFSVRSAYLLASDIDTSGSEPLWRQIWSWKGTQLVAWRPGDEGWSILNTDGSRYRHSGSTAIGGLIRTDQGRFIHAFTANMGDCSITRAEICAIVQGMKLAWDLGIRKLLIQSDSEAAVAILRREDTNHQHAILVSEFMELRSRSWDISITHVFREANCGADYLANLGHSYCFGLHLFSQPDSTLAHWLRFDLIGVTSPRVISFY
ncbi:Putative ribonuclease H protein At1g65750 [Linum perenne]